MTGAHMAAGGKHSGAVPIPGMESFVAGERAEPGVLFTHNPLPMWVYDQNTLRFLQVNDAAIEHYGYSRSEFLTMTIADIRPSEDVPVLLEDVRDRSRPIQRSGRWRHVHKDGAIRIVDIDSHTIDFAGIPAVLVVAHDVTERERAQDAMRVSEARYRELFENANDIIYIHDLEGRFISINRAAERLTGWTRDELASKNFADFVAPEYLHRAREAVSRKLSNPEATTTYELEILTKSGARLPLEVSTRLILEGGKPVAVEGVARDVSDRKRAQDVIRRQAERAEALALVSRSISDARLDLPSILDSVAAMASGLIGDACVVRLLNDSGEELDTVAVRHPNTDAIGMVQGIARATTYRADEGLHARMVESEGPILIEKVDPNDMPESVRPHYTEYIRRFGIESILAAPLRVQGTIIGSITMTRDADGNAYNSDDQRFLVELADRAAIAIANARLFEMTRHRLRQVQALRRIDTSIIGTTLDVGTTLDGIVDQIRAELQVDAACVLLFDPLTRALRFASGSGFSSSERDLTPELEKSDLAGVVFERRLLITQELSSTGFARKPMAIREGFMTHIAVPLVARTEVKGVLEVFHRSRFEPTSAWREFLDGIATQAAIAIDNAQMFEELQRANIEQALAYESTLEGWSRALDLRDQETEGHSTRVAHATVRLSRAMGMSGEDLVNIRRGALLHDIGKMGVPDAILRKPGPLTDDEWEIMRRHPLYAYEMLAPTRFLRPVLDVPYSHHERWDGSGYPRGVSGEEIPLAARIFAIVDVWDALRSDRSYRPRLPEHQVTEYLADHAGKLFDPEVTKLFLSLGM